MMIIRQRSNSPSPRRGLGMIETVMAIVMVSVLLVAALNTLGASQLGQKNTSTHTIGHALAQTLMAEIVSQPYEDPDGFPVFGLEATENGVNRIGFDDVDDYVNWTKRAPQKKNGIAQQLSAGWERAATVEWVDPADLTTAVVLDTGVKRITVTTTYNGTTIVDLVAFRTAGPPEPSTAIKVLFVVVDQENLTSQETAKRDLMVTWGFIVQLIAEKDGMANYTTAASNNDVAFVSLDVTDSALPGKIKYQSLGIVNEQWAFIDPLGFGTGTGQVSETDIWAYNNTHYIMSGYPNDLVPMLTSVQPIFIFVGVLASGAKQVGLLRRSGNVYYPALVTIELGATIYGGGRAVDRRVQLPWGGATFDINALNDDGRTFLKRSIEWAASMEADVPPPIPPICGDGLCEPAETCVCLADCFFIPWFETSCTDGYDNDCDGFIDCDDTDCVFDPACVVCGNGLCEMGEDCHSCSADCQQKSGGNPVGRYCCGDGILQIAEGSGFICDFNP